MTNPEDLKLAEQLEALADWLIAPNSTYEGNADLPIQVAALIRFQSQMLEEARKTIREATKRLSDMHCETCATNGLVGISLYPGPENLADELRELLSKLEPNNG